MNRLASIFFFVLFLTLGRVGLADPPSALAKSPDPDYCYGMTDAQKSAQLDHQMGVTLKAPDLNSTVFVVIQSSNRTDHGLPTGVCGVRVDIYKKGPGGALVKMGRWEDLKAGHCLLGNSVVGVNHCLLKLDYEVSENDDHDQGVVLDDSGRTTVWNAINDLGDAAWFRRNGKDMIFVSEREGIGVKTAELKKVWMFKDNSRFWGGFSPQAHYAYDRLGTTGAEVAVYDWDGKAMKFKMPFLATKGHKEFMGLTDKPELLLRIDRKVYRIGLDGTYQQVALIPHYPHRFNSLDFYSANDEFEDSEGLIREYNFQALGDAIKDEPRPRVKVNIDTLEAQESLDGGKTWHPIDIKVKEPAVGK